MNWLIQDLVRPVATRAGGQAGAFAVALGVAGEHQHAIAAVVAWGVLTLAEVLVSARARENLKAKAKSAWGKN